MRKLMSIAKQKGTRQTQEKRNTYWLTDCQLDFCEEYLDNALENLEFCAERSGSTLEEATKFLKLKDVKRYLNYRKKQIEKTCRGVPMDYKCKLMKLAKVADVCIPDNAEVAEQFNSMGLTAIAEMNKMSGDYSPTKTTNVNVSLDPDVQETKDMVSEIMEQNRNSY